ncbi:MAG: 50S ribosomal protein L11 methyltransferase [Microthrixaceae bacterium]|nr:50S ribosomal protein L11 methyltransferase [Microthrixaceae bacterium]
MGDPAIDAVQPSAVQLTVSWPAGGAAGRQPGVRPRGSDPSASPAELVAAVVWGGAGGRVPVPDGVEERAVDPGGERVSSGHRWVLSWLTPPTDDQLIVLGEALGRLGATVAEPVAVAHDTGLDAWREHARPVEAGPFVVRPPWLPGGPNPDRRDLWIDPGRTFGSGSHQSTRAVLELLAAMPLGGAHVVDVGSGSGILGVAAALLGASRVELVELDPFGEDVGLANAALNGVGERVAWAGTDVGCLPDPPVDAPPGRPQRVIVANMLIGELEAVASDLRRLAGPDGRLVLGGVLDSQVDRLIEAVGPARRIDERSEPSESDPSVAWAALTLTLEELGGSGDPEVAR